MGKLEINKNDIVFRDLCPLCGATERKLRWIKSSPRVSESVHIFQCKGCDFVYSQEVLTPDAAKVFYDGLYRDGNYQSYDSQSETKLKNWTEVLKRVLTKTQGKPQRHLDLGCGEGYGMMAAQKLGLETTGVEFCESAALKARTRKIGEVYVADLENLEDVHELKPGGFDLITGFDSLDHVANPLEVLRKVTRLLSPDGLIYFNVTDIGSYYVVVMGENFPHLCPFEHLSYFSRTTLKSVLTLSRLRYIDMTSEKRKLNYDYVVTDFKENNPPLYRLISPLSKVIPPAIRRYNLSVPFGTLGVIAGHQR